MQRTKAGPKLAVPRPVNLPSLKKVGPAPRLGGRLRQPPTAPRVARVPQENAGNEPGAPSSGAVGWSSGGGDAATADALPVDGGAEPSSSLVEKASWAGHGRSAPPAPWEQPRALNLREFPSLAAAAAVPQHPTHTHRGASSTQATFSGAWDEDERGPPRHGHALAGDRGHSRDAAGHDAYQDSTARYRRGMQPTYGRHRGDFSPPRDHRDEAYRHGTTPYQGAYGGWRDDRDWQRHDRCPAGLAGQRSSAGASVDYRARAQPASCRRGRVLQLSLLRMLTLRMCHAGSMAPCRGLRTKGRYRRHATMAGALVSGRTQMTQISMARFTTGEIALARGRRGWSLMLAVATESL